MSCLCYKSMVRKHYANLSHVFHLDHPTFVLKLKKFSDLRENPKYPQVITPCYAGHDEVYYFFINSACEKFKRLQDLAEKKTNNINKQSVSE